MKNKELIFNPAWTIVVKALYHDRQGDWDKAHQLVDNSNTKSAAHVHAYLHRKEGDQWNAEYWYDRAHQPVFQGSIEEEWEDLWRRYN